MMAITHVAIAAVGTSLLLGISDLTYLALAVVGSQLPDFDSTEGILGQSYCRPGPCKRGRGRWAVGLHGPAGWRTLAVSLARSINLWV
ncbi:hypothetical protein IQ254_18490 [Nodosilinea sp. LEGE 07088]|uniref:hypothetical protein n=1 Tax=Nodosilinea sp. LEGE 07088 TaxID=2777968 RepID=UPI0018805003|nr:hypothetical protein [Nodosilinea sp. LEGE 07088]MBE9139159.1 hypothetical protein [Nodosilinea sp. LEGE 07088]